MGKNITLVGGNGDGQTCKVANQIIVALNIEAVGEALLFASKAGADPAKVRQALMGGFAASRILEVHGERMIKRTFDPGFRIELHQKDLNLALAERARARRLACRTPPPRRSCSTPARRTAARLGPFGDGARARNHGESRNRAACKVNRRRRALTNHECPPPGSPFRHPEGWAKPISSPGCNIPALQSPADASIPRPATRSGAPQRWSCAATLSPLRSAMHESSRMLRAA